MNKDQKTDVDLDIMNLVNQMIENPENTKDVVMYIRGDAEFQTASVNIKGDMKLLAQTLQHFLDTNPAFKQFLLSVVGSWLNGNPEEELMFLNGLETLKKTFIVN